MRSPRSSLIFVALASCAMSFGQTYYTSKVTTINAGVLLLSQDLQIPANYAAIPPFLGYSENATPFVWYNLDKNSTVKPGGWNFVNPVSNGVADATMSARWQAIERMPAR